MVRCADCGFLALRRGDGELIEADLDFRRHGEHGALHPVGAPQRSHLPRIEPVYTVILRPLCLLQRIRDTRAEFEAVLRERLEDETTAAGKSVFPTAEHRVWFVERDRDCDGFTPWVQGFTPKEHQEARDREMERDRANRAENFRLFWGIVGTAFFSLTGVVLGWLLASW